MTLRLLTATLLSVVIGFTLSCQNPKTNQPAPKLALDTLEIDMGEMFAGEEKSMNVGMRNIGGDTLHIIDVSTSCGCTAVKKPKPFLLKGEGDVLGVRFNSTNFRGKVTKYVIIRTNDPVKAETNLILHANVLSDIAIVSPGPAVDLGRVTVGQEKTIKVVLKNSGNKVVSVTGAESAEGEVQLLRGGKGIPPKGTGEVTVSLAPAKMGFIVQHIVLKTSSRTQRRISLTVIYTGVAAG